MPPDPHRPPWRVVLAGLFAFNLAIGALSITQPADLFWLATPIAQVGIFAALMLAVVTPAFDFLRVFFRRLEDLNSLNPLQAVGAHLGLGAIASLGTTVGRAIVGGGGGGPEVALVLIANAIAAALVFLLTARLVYHRGRRAGM